jgi:hypothetical protein
VRNDNADNYPNCIYYYHDNDYRDYYFSHRYVYHNYNRYIHNDNAHVQGTGDAMV